MQPYAMTYNNIDILSRKRQIMLYVILTVTLLNITLKQGTNHVACQSDLKIFRIKLFLKLVKNNISFISKTLCFPYFIEHIFWHCCVKWKCSLQPFKFFI